MIMRLSLDLIFASCKKAEHSLPVPVSAGNAFDINDMVIVKAEWYNNTILL